MFTPETDCYSPETAPRPEDITAETLLRQPNQITSYLNYYDQQRAQLILEDLSTDKLDQQTRDMSSNLVQLVESGKIIRGELTSAEAEALVTSLTRVRYDDRTCLRRIGDEPAAQLSVTLTECLINRRHEVAGNNWKSALADLHQCVATLTPASPVEQHQVIYDILHGSMPDVLVKPGQNTRTYPDLDPHLSTNGNLVGRAREFAPHAVADIPELTIGVDITRVAPAEYLAAIDRHKPRNLQIEHQRRTTARDGTNAIFAHLILYGRQMRGIQEAQMFMASEDRRDTGPVRADITAPNPRLNEQSIIDQLQARLSVIINAKNLAQMNAKFGIVHIDIDDRKYQGKPEQKMLALQNKSKPHLRELQAFQDACRQFELSSDLRAIIIGGVQNLDRLLYLNQVSKKVGRDYVPETGFHNLDEPTEPNLRPLYHALAETGPYSELFRSYYDPETIRRSILRSVEQYQRDLELDIREPFIHPSGAQGFILRRAEVTAEVTQDQVTRFLIENRGVTEMDGEFIRMIAMHHDKQGISLPDSPFICLVRPEELSMHPLAMALSEEMRKLNDQLPRNMDLLLAMREQQAQLRTHLDRVPSEAGDIYDLSELSHGLFRSGRIYNPEDQQGVRFEINMDNLGYAQLPDETVISGHVQYQGDRFRLVFDQGQDFGLQSEQQWLIESVVWDLFDNSCQTRVYTELPDSHQTDTETDAGILVETRVGYLARVGGKRKDGTPRQFTPEAAGFWQQHMVDTFGICPVSLAELSLAHFNSYENRDDAQYLTYVRPVRNLDTRREVAPLHRALDDLTVFQSRSER